MTKAVANKIKELDWDVIYGDEAHALQLTSLIHKLVNIHGNTWAHFMTMAVTDAITMLFNEGEIEMADEQPIEEVRAIAYYIEELLTRMDFEPNRFNVNIRKDSTIYERGHLHVGVTVQWHGELPK